MNLNLDKKAQCNSMDCQAQIYKAKTYVTQIRPVN